MLSAIAVRRYKAFITLDEMKYYLLINDKKTRLMIFAPSPRKDIVTAIFPLVADCLSLRLAGK